MSPRWAQALQVLASSRPLRIHMIAVGGTGMAPLACLLRQLGHDVVGSDAPLYPPMSGLLADAGIEPMVGFRAEHLEDPRPDLVIVGNAVPRTNPEAVATEQLGIAHVSMPEAVGHFLLSGRRPLVACGTHGKTTTSTMAAWVLRECGADPGYLVGGAPLGLDGSFALGGGDRFVIEGDEYNAAYFDRGPKFLHYRAQTVTLTSVEYDHVDLYPDPESFRGAFERLVAGLPADGHLVACADAPEVLEVASGAPCRVTAYGTRIDEPSGPSGPFVLRPVGEPVADASGTRFTVQWEGERHEVRLRLWGRHNVANALAVWCATVADGHEPAAVAAALSSFTGVRRRLEVRGEPGGVAVVDDFAHHPTEVAASLSALRQRFGERRLVALFEPRSLSAGRSAFLAEYEEAFSVADAVHLAPVFHADRLGEEERLDLGELCGRLHARGVAATHHDDVDGLVAAAVADARPGDVLVTMSSGAFGGAPGRLLEALG